MQINVLYASSVTSLSPALQADFEEAVGAAVAFWDHAITSPVAVTITFGWGTAGPLTIIPGDSGSSYEYGQFYSYGRIRTALIADAVSPAALTAVSTLPLIDLTSGGSLFVPYGQQQALGLAPSPSPSYVVLNPAVGYDWNPDSRATGSLIDATGQLEHEISETLGRFDLLGQSGEYSALDLFRYASAGVRDLLTPGAGYFSLDGLHMLLPFNSPADGGDLGDWESSVIGDSFGTARGGVPSTVSGVDLQVMQAIGYHIAAPVPYDFTADGESGILFGQSDGALATWEMGGTAIVGGGALGSPGAGWTYVGSGDFNGDLAADLLFVRADGMVATWQLYGPNTIGGGNIGAPGGTWTPMAIGDFNGDGMSDILFKDTAGDLAIWEMNGTSIIGGGDIGNPGGTWEVVGTGDFNGDGKSDILFQNAAGDLAIWEMNGTSIIGGGDIGNPGGTWAEKGIGDFNGDGKSDILFEDAAGDYAIWEMNGTAIIGGGDIGNPGGTWQFAGIGDYNGDGMSDILFTDAAGDLAIWEMNGTSIIGGGDIGNPGAVWHVLG